MPAPRCAVVRSRLAEALDDPLEKDLARHLAACRECAEQLEAARAALAAAGRIHPSEDPGEAYWDGFLPSVRARLSARAPGGSSSIPAARDARVGWLAAAAAFVVMAGAGAAALLLPDRLSREEAPLLLERRLDTMLSAFAGNTDDLSAILGATSDEPAPVTSLEPEEGWSRIGPAAVIEALDGLDRAPVPGSLWDEGMEHLVDQLDAGAATTLREALAREQG